MKYYESKFEDYVNSTNKNNLHPQLKKIYDEIFKKDNQSHLILYGSSGIGKYSQSLKFIQKYSPSKLKYERKINFLFKKETKKEYIFKISDIHIEIDLELLGCNSKILFNDIYYHALNIFLTNKSKHCIILCKNFDKINEDLLENFSSYMQTLFNDNIFIRYIILSENIGFIPTNILERCQVISMAKPKITKYKKMFNKNVKTKDNFTNIKNIMSKVPSINDEDNKIVNNIYALLKDYENINFITFREQLYNIFIYNLDLNSCIYGIIKLFMKDKKIKKQHLNKIFHKTYDFLKYYNNNYRPIYHLERYLISLCIIIYEL